MTLLVLSLAVATTLPLTAMSLRVLSRGRRGGKEAAPAGHNLPLTERGQCEAGIAQLVERPPCNREPLVRIQLPASFLQIPGCPAP